MRHYEIVILVHPDQTPQLEGMVSRYRSMIEKGGGAVHRSEDWGRRQLAFTINKVRKAHYYLMNVECSQTVLDELNSGFRYNDAILRHLVLVKDKAYTEPSPMAIDTDRKSKHKRASEKAVVPSVEAPSVEAPSVEQPAEGSVEAPSVVAKVASPIESESQE